MVAFEDVSVEGQTTAVIQRTARGNPVAPVGARCVSDFTGDSHAIEHPEDDVGLQTVRRDLVGRQDLSQLIGDAVEDSIFYVLDGYRTHRFDLLDERVEADERRTVGTKLQYHLLDNLGLEKKRHPDTEIAGVPVDVKGTATTDGSQSWMIPREGQCELCLLVHVDLVRDRHRAWLMRTHRAFLHNGDGNGDRKRGISVPAFNTYSVPLYEWTPLRPNPLKGLSEPDRAVVFGSAGQETRLKALFRVAAETVIPRGVILTVCANRADPMRRVRATRVDMAREGIALLCGTWTSHRQLADVLAFDLTGEAWVAVAMSKVLGHGELTGQVLEQMRRGLKDEADRKLFEP
ncbi:NaeI family type II restriction endonuclease [Micromonospora sp. NPDC000729]|uniref:NaeI family type II restriction endonuclease n=1 Tax=Micromonospora sp. NPDC000729 TaxID=3364220 RepID=UPI0036D116D3